MWLLEVRWKSTCPFVAHVGLQVAMGQGVWVKPKVWWTLVGEGQKQEILLGAGENTLGQKIGESGIYAVLAEK